jgi:uncharacterized protein (DUF433 family)
MTLAETLIPRRPPLKQDENGALRVGDTRVTLDMVVQAYENGGSAEEIALAYDSLELADVHAVISFYLQNRERVHAYLRERQQTADQSRQQFPPRESWQQLRQRLIKRRQGQQG